MKHVFTCIAILLQTTFLFAENQVFYNHEDLSLISITSPTIKWQELKEPINNGLNNGVYWFKIELEPSDIDRIISIPEAHISRANLYLNGEEIKKEENTRYVTFRIKSHSTQQRFHLKVDCLLDASIPIEITSIEEYFASETKNHILFSLYFGIVAAILLFNLFSYINLKRKIYLHYLIVCIGMIMTPFYKGGISGLIFGLTGINEVLEAVISGIVVIGGVYFTASYFKMHREMPRTWKLAIYILITAYLCSITFLITRSALFFAAYHVLLILTLDIFVVSSIVLWKKSVSARFFAIAYGFPLIAAHEYFISCYFGLPLMDIPISVFMAGSVLEMIIFSYVITLQVKHVIIKNNLMRTQLLDYTQKLKYQNKGLNQSQETIIGLTEKFQLTKKEIEILKILSLNKTNKEIADLQFISENTVKYHIKNICKKLEVNCKQDAKYRYLHFDKENA